MAIGPTADSPVPSLPAAPAAEDAYLQLRELVTSIVRRHTHTGLLQTTALVHEAWLKLGATYGGRPDQQGRAALAASVIRSVLVDEARREGRAKRGGGWRRVSLDEVFRAQAPALDLIELDQALSELADLSDRRARIVELRFFGGLTVQATATALAVSPRTVQLEWEQAKAWLRVRLEQARQENDAC